MSKSEKQNQNSHDKPWLFAKGQSGNPNGHPPKVKCIPDILKAIGEEEIETEMGKMTRLDVVMRKVYKFALEGRAWAVQFISERTEGKVPLNITAKSNTPFCIVLDPTADHNQLEAHESREERDITDAIQVIEKTDAGVDSASGQS